ELIEYIGKISGATLEIATVNAPLVDGFLAKAHAAKRTPIFIGRNVNDLLKRQLEAKGAARGTFALKVTDDAVMIAGIGEGPAYGVSELLEQQGVRWFMPGDLGTVIPALKTITAASQETVQAPAFASRW